MGYNTTQLGPKIQTLVGDIIHPRTYKFMELLTLEKGDNDITSSQISTVILGSNRLQVPASKPVHKRLHSCCLTTAYSPQQTKSSVLNCALPGTYAAKNPRRTQISFTSRPKSQIKQNPRLLQHSYITQDLQTFWRGNKTEKLRFFL
jgi:hypothetical protein